MLDSLQSRYVFIFEKSKQLKKYYLYFVNILLLPYKHENRIRKLKDENKKNEKFLFYLKLKKILHILCSLQCCENENA